MYRVFVRLLILASLTAAAHYGYKEIGGKGISTFLFGVAGFFWLFGEHFSGAGFFHGLRYVNARSPGLAWKFFALFLIMVSFVVIGLE